MGFLDRLLGKHNESDLSEKYAEEFKTLWENKEFEEAKNLLENKWYSVHKKYEVNYAYAVIIVAATVDSVSNSKLYDMFSLLNKENNDSNLGYWYKDMAERAISFQAQEEIKNLNYCGVPNVFRVG